MTTPHTHTCITYNQVILYWASFSSVQHTTASMEEPLQHAALPLHLQRIHRAFNLTPYLHQVENLIQEDKDNDEFSFEKQLSFHQKYAKRLVFACVHVYCTCSVVHVYNNRRAYLYMYCRLILIPALYVLCVSLSRKQSSPLQTRSGSCLYNFIDVTPERQWIQVHKNNMAAIVCWANGQ